MSVPRVHLCVSVLLERTFWFACVRHFQLLCLSLALLCLLLESEREENRGKMRVLVAVLVSALLVAAFVAGVADAKKKDPKECEGQ